ILVRVVPAAARRRAQSMNREALTVEQEPQGAAASQQEGVSIPAEAQWTYSNRSYWYPQGAVTDYATANMTLTVSGEYDIVASGTPEGPATLMPAAPGQRPRKRF